jgi:hypothetical protein
MFSNASADISPTIVILLTDGPVKIYFGYTLVTFLQ